MTTKTKTRCMTAFVVFAAAVLFASACYRAEQTRLSLDLPPVARASIAIR